VSAIHTATITTRVLPNGLTEFSGTSTNRAITDWSLADAEPTASIRIPKQRAGNARDTQLLSANGGEQR
jgi:hypothetical protein